MVVVHEVDPVPLPLKLGRRRNAVGGVSLCCGRMLIIGEVSNRVGRLAAACWLGAEGFLLACVGLRGRRHVLVVSSGEEAVAMVRGPSLAGWPVSG